MSRKELTRQERMFLSQQEVYQFEIMLLEVLVTQNHNPKITSFSALLATADRKKQELLKMYPEKKTFIIKATFSVRERIKPLIDIYA